MQLTFRHSQKVCDGYAPAGFNYRDQELFVMFNNAVDTLQYVVADTPEGSFDDLLFSEPADAIHFKDSGVSNNKAYSYSGEEHWITWLKNPAHRITKYKYKLYFPLIAFQVRAEELIRLIWQEPYWETVEEEPS